MKKNKMIRGKQYRYEYTNYLGLYLYRKNQNYKVSKIKYCINCIKKILGLIFNKKI
jgi:hypothetical protein